MRGKGVAFTCQMPLCLRDAAKVAAAQHKVRFGGQLNMNRVLVKALYQHLLEHLQPEERRDIDRFLDQV